MVREWMSPGLYPGCKMTPNNNNPIIRRHQKTTRDGATQGRELRYNTGMRIGEPETRDAKLLGTNRGPMRQVEGGRGGERTRATEL